ncbi:Conserved oligomeric golgi complex subunit 4-like protein [Quillaja saponaria]|uniref:Conserved oligomeric golgi complex subunit 4-like protein n=1 Tax=Quillaja saponaria TaxID=32244 RepID=A0AAD7LUM7_QUISA|nr:Conserved oligomeric golgi complex subunit 4-like protein [Quillaja saponaria]
MTWLHHECIAYQRAIDLDLDDFLSQLSDLDKQLLQLQRSSEVLEFVKSDSDYMLSNVSSPANSPIMSVAKSASLTSHNHVFVPHYPALIPLLREGIA